MNAWRPSFSISGGKAWWRRTVCCCCRSVSLMSLECKFWLTLLSSVLVRSDVLRSGLRFAWNIFTLWGNDRAPVFWVTDSAVPSDLLPSLWSRWCPSVAYWSSSWSELPTAVCEPAVSVLYVASVDRKLCEATIRAPVFWATDSAGSELQFLSRFAECSALILLPRSSFLIRVLQLQFSIVQVASVDRKSGLQVVSGAQL